MRRRYVAQAARVSVAVALVLLGLVSSSLSDTAKASPGGGPTILQCGGFTSDNPGVGPTTASGVSAGESESAVLGLCIAADQSNGQSPAPVTTGTCGSATADAI